MSAPDWLALVRAVLEPHEAYTWQDAKSPQRWHASCTCSPHWYAGPFATRGEANRARAEHLAARIARGLEVAVRAGWRDENAARAFEEATR